MCFQSKVIAIHGIQAGKMALPAHGHIIEEPEECNSDRGMKQLEE